MEGIQRENRITQDLFIHCNPSKGTLEGEELGGDPEVAREPGCRQVTGKVVKPFTIKRRCKETPSLELCCCDLARRPRPAWRMA